MSSASGLSRHHRIQARHRVLQGAELMMGHRAAVHYTMGGQRWEGINQHLVAAHGHYPDHSDCSSSFTWLMWNGMFIPFKHHDNVNGAHWKAGYTGTLAQHGRPVTHDRNLEVGAGP